MSEFVDERAEAEASGPLAEGADRKALSQLEAAVGNLLAETERLRARTRTAEERARDVESLLRRFEAGEEDPAQLFDRLGSLEAENRDLKDRVRKGREGVERLMARIRFLEEAQ